MERLAAGATRRQIVGGAQADCTSATSSQRPKVDTIMCIHHHGKNSTVKLITLCGRPFGTGQTLTTQEYLAIVANIFWILAEGCFCYVLPGWDSALVLQSAFAWPSN